MLHGPKSADERLLLHAIRNELTPMRLVPVNHPDPILRMFRQKADAIHALIEGGYRVPVSDYGYKYVVPARDGGTIVILDEEEVPLWAPPTDVTVEFLYCRLCGQRYAYHPSRKRYHMRECARAWNRALNKLKKAGNLSPSPDEIRLVAGVLGVDDHRPPTQLTPNSN